LALANKHWKLARNYWKNFLWKNMEDAKRGKDKEKN
jgi:hypothetical protein